jgi:hypothetical protein
MGSRGAFEKRSPAAREWSQDFFFARIAV